MESPSLLPCFGLIEELGKSGKRNIERDGFTASGYLVRGEVAKTESQVVIGYGRPVCGSECLLAISLCLVTTKDGVPGRK